MRLILIVLGTLFIAAQSYAKPIHYIQNSKMSAQLAQTAALVFNDESRAIFLDTETYTNPVDVLCDTLAKLDDHKPKSILISFDILENLDSGFCIVDAAIKMEVPIVLVANNFQDLYYKIPPHYRAAFETWIGRSYIDIIRAQPEQENLPAASIRNSYQTTGSFASDLIFQNPAFAEAILKAKTSTDLQNFDASIAEYVTLGDFSASQTAQVTFQDALLENPEALAELKDKYVIVGLETSASRKYPNNSGEMVNTTTLYQQMMASYLYLIETKEPYPRYTRLVFVDEIPNLKTATLNN